jgi:hypothetical protein
MKPPLKDGKKNIRERDFKQAGWTAKQKRGQ